MTEPREDNGRRTLSAQEKRRFAIGAGSALFGSHGAFRRPLPGGNDDDTQQ